MCRSPCGERGLKFEEYDGDFDFTESLPVRGAWIEILPVRADIKCVVGRSPCGERGLK